MNFFEHQEQARRVSARLTMLFMLYVALLVVLVNAVARWLYLSVKGPAAAVPLSLYVTVSLIVLGVIAAGTLFKLLELREGGAAAARMVGGRLVDPSTGDRLERRLLNVVQEMALAAGLAVPRVYVLDREISINAFAAGYSPNEAVIAVTRGTLTRLSRSELQGVIGHEFSHILNGDMALNLRLVGVLHGLLVLALGGRYLMEGVTRARINARSLDGNVTLLFVLGAGLWALGYVGVLVGRLIKASVSRQREFLADASSVQFTRNPDGLGSALRKIGKREVVGAQAVERGVLRHAELGAGSQLQHPQSEALSHMFMAPALRALSHGWLATHPPLEERVRRIYGRAMPWLPAPEQTVALTQTSTHAGTPLPYEPYLYEPYLYEPRVDENLNALARPLNASPLTGWVHTPPTPEGVVQVVGQVAALPSLFPSPAAPGPSPSSTSRTELEVWLTDSTRAPWVVFALLTDKAQAVQAQQRQLMTEAFGTGAAQKLDELHAHVQDLPAGVRLPLLERAVPVLARLSWPERERVLQLAHALIAADGRVTLIEFLLFTVLQRRIGAQAGRAVPIRYKTLVQVQHEVGLVLSLLAALREPQRPGAAYNAGLLLASGVDQERTEVTQLSLDAVTAALDRLNHLAPLVKPIFVRACAATALLEGAINWEAASCLRAVCAAIDAPLPPMV